jgi:hypothetical protein
MFSIGRIISLELVVIMISNAAYIQKRNKSQTIAKEGPAKNSSPVLDRGSFLFRIGDIIFKKYNL